MVQIRRSAIVRYTPEQMFDLVNDVEAYPKRFSWCVGATLLERQGDTLVARLDLRFAGLRHGFTTRNRGHRPARLDMELVDGPFRKLDGVWTFTPMGDAGCKVALELDFEFSSRLGAAALRIGFQSLANRMVDDFCAEAKRAYG
ncbi:MULTISPECIES: type II toxin-antitoxin system RatA family toxin [Oleiagrimonas]|uniref:Type II toxin-antitoxin system RatA family toxin n=1 Tax=Oleiagrimonas citrea TaxID=1665687 RepID=A0A846ZD49_9GAMM|nr:type II toxin-antitoxin system RatA family toxin [Oleiagrimonas sp. MCCC 1A03011]NKZ37445.1 type II toxin-antitoxin system RatA family toxin [Oleiagrimonas citrea]RAP57947.1 ubiquinone-binding protein [Oleiagrimonas sp. MCCC 1A03011]